MRFLRTSILSLLLALPALPASASWGIQIGAFDEHAKAEEIQVVLEDAGYRSYWLKEGRHYKVRVGAYDSANDASSEAGALWHFLLARFGPGEFDRPWVMENFSEPESAHEEVRFPTEVFNMPYDAPADATAEFLLREAQALLGTPYRWGGASNDGFDCSGFTSYVFNRAGLTLPHRAADQFQMGEKIPAENLRPGDLVFYRTYNSGPSHVGIYAGGGEFIHASSGSGMVVATSMAKAYYVKRYLGARRIAAGG